ncbi:MAG TPA: TetR family transcriptional regulator [Actinophytocola sp.]|jgi:AcrR family transcriptional regulator|nr:TetR family transcriptional regulator [Actinophytocola sp.]
MTTGQPPRRRPNPGERQRDPERTRARILDAAKVEFGAKGFAGARVSDIADRAGVNKQLISYYFGGKEGLYTELNNQWQQVSAQLSSADQPLDALVAGYTLSALHDRDMARLMVWANMSPTDAPADTGQEREFLQAQVEDLRRRQEAGELPADLDPACVLLALFAAASATVTLPRTAAAICGAAAGSDDFVRHYADQLARLVRHLGNSGADGRPGSQRDGQA